MIMAASAFAPASEAYRSAMPPANSHTPNGSGSRSFDSDALPSLANPLSSHSPPVVELRFRKLPPTVTIDSFRCMALWSRELMDVELLPLRDSPDAGYRAGIMRFRTMSGAKEVRDLLDGAKNPVDEARMIVEILLPSTPNTNLISNGRRTSVFDGSFSAFDKFSPTMTGPFSPQTSEVDTNGHYTSFFNAQSPIGHHLADRPRISGKTIINDNLDDDDETSDLLKDPVAYAENGATQRRATAPQLPIGAMAGLSLNTHVPHSMGSSLPPYASSAVSQAGHMSPISGGNPLNINYPLTAGATPFGRHNFPPVNPADQNPPCNTLYVGNLPIDTSEEELKAMFSKQRGYKRLCFRTKQNGPMCFVEFEDVSFATKALNELYGHPLHNSVKGGIRLSFSKNPLGVRSGHSHGSPTSAQMSGINGMMMGSLNGFTTANGPPPGLSVPPGLGSSRGNYNLASPSNGGGSGSGSPYQGSGYQNGRHGPPAWNGPPYAGGLGAGNAGGNAAMNGTSYGGNPGNGNSRQRTNGNVNVNPAFLPPHYMGR